MSEHEQDPVDVLLVEDDPGDALMTRESFAQAGKNNRFHVIPDGHEALRFLRQEGEYARALRPGLILLDLNLPDGAIVRFEMPLEWVPRSPARFLATETETSAR